MTELIDAAKKARLAMPVLITVLRKAGLAQGVIVAEEIRDDLDAAIAEAEKEKPRR